MRSRIVQKSGLGRLRSRNGIRIAIAKLIFVLLNSVAPLLLPKPKPKFDVTEGQQCPNLELATSLNVVFDTLAAY